MTAAPAQKAVSRQTSSSSSRQRAPAPVQVSHIFYCEDSEDGDDENFAKDGDYDDGDYGGYEDATLQQRASRGPAPIQVIITRRPCPKVSYVSLLKDHNSQPQESKV